ncbi:MAG: hypothetical protein J7L15_04335 [Clostridiales bacterium]|nr:hypothetical protein [Clostridiales bacterium]
MNKVITFSDSKYFKYGSLFLSTRNKISAHFILYGPDLTVKQIRILSSHNIEYKEVDPEDFATKMMFLKFQHLYDEIDGSGGGISFLDFDTFFVSEWSHIFDFDFDLGITARNDFIKKNSSYYAFSNGGVIFAKNSHKSKALCLQSMDIMKSGSSVDLPEYDEIFLTLETGRPLHKTHYRTTLRWWVDQVFLSSFVLRHVRNTGGGVNNYDSMKFMDYNIGFFNCDIYNKIDPSFEFCKNAVKKQKPHIIHLKFQGRNKINKIRRII